jgi:peptide/nickel transport system permease protein
MVAAGDHSSSLPVAGTGGRRARRAFLRHSGTVVGGSILFIFLAISLLAPLLWTSDPLSVEPVDRLQGMSAKHWFGTDMHGRDLYSRVVYGGRVSLLVGFSVAFLASVIGGVIGLFAGFVRPLDGPLMRVMDGFLSIPPIMLAIALVALTRGSIQNVIIAIAIAEIPRVSRLVRGVVLTLREQPYVEAAISMGAGPLRIVFRHILPNAVGPIVVQATFICASAMLAEAALSFIGAGTPPITPSWGNILAEGRMLWQLHPAMVFLPAAALSLTVLAVNMLGDGLSDIFDPRGLSKD